MMDITVPYWVAIIAISPWCFLGAWGLANTIDRIIARRKARELHLD